LEENLGINGADLIGRMADASPITQPSLSKLCSKCKALTEPQKITCWPYTSCVHPRDSRDMRH